MKGFWVESFCTKFQAASEYGRDPELSHPGSVFEHCVFNLIKRKQRAQVSPDSNKTTPPWASQHCEEVMFSRAVRSHSCCFVRV